MTSAPSEVVCRTGPRVVGWLLSLLVLVPLGGCGIGSGAVRQSRLKYNMAFQETEKQELLLNLVRHRYGDPVEFLPIASITTQFEFSGSATGNGLFNNLISDQLGIFDSSNVGVTAGVAERPTVAMSPRREQDFLRRSLLPIAEETIYLLLNSGQAFDQTFAMVIDSIGGLGVAPGDPAYQRAVGLLDDLMATKAIYFTFEEREVSKSEPVGGLELTAANLIEAADKGFRFVPEGGGETLKLTAEEIGLKLNVSEQALAMGEFSELTMLLNLEPGHTSYDVERVTNFAPRGPFDQPGDTIRIKPRSLHNTMRRLSRGVCVPAPHVNKGYVAPLDDVPGCPIVDSDVIGSLIAIRSSKLPPKHANVAIKYRGYWFYIDEADSLSKETFRSMYLLIAAEVSGEFIEGVDQPVLTIPLGDVGG